MSLYAVNLKLDNKPCIVVGGGTIAERKVRSLLGAGAVVTVLSPQLNQGLTELVQNGTICHVDRTYENGDIAGFFIVICATDNTEVNVLVAKEAQQKGVLVNVVDAPEAGNFNVPSQISHGDLLLTISTGGKSPALAKQLKQELAKQYGPEYGVYLELLAAARLTMKEKIKSSKERESFWRQTIDQDVIHLLKQGKIKEAEAKINNAISCFGAKS